MIVFYELTQACDLACQHCRACAQPKRSPDELTAEQSKAMISQLAEFPTRPLLVMTGGDPLKRDDVFELVEHAVSEGLEVAMTPSATPLVTTGALERLKKAGLHRLAVSLDGPDAASHDRFRGVLGSYGMTLEIVEDARRLGIPVQINTTVSKYNVRQIDEMAEMLGGMGIVLWSVFFLVPTGRATAQMRLTAEECEDVFEKLWKQSVRQPYAIKTTEAPHYRRFLQQRAKELGAAAKRPGAPRPLGTNDGKGVMFISHSGAIYPSGFLPVECGRFPQDSVVRVYQESALFRDLRDSSRLGGKCGACEFKEVCGGSRARAMGVYGDPLAQEPDCAYQPARWKSVAGLA